MQALSDTNAGGLELKVFPVSIVSYTLCENFLHDVAVNVGEAEIAAGVAVGELSWLRPIRCKRVAWRS